MTIVTGKLRDVRTIEIIAYRDTPDALNIIAELYNHPEAGAGEFTVNIDRPAELIITIDLSVLSDELRARIGRQLAIQEQRRLAPYLKRP